MLRAVSGGSDPMPPGLRRATSAHVGLLFGFPGLARRDGSASYLEPRSGSGQGAAAAGEGGLAARNLSAHEQRGAEQRSRDAAAAAASSHRGARGSPLRPRRSGTASSDPHSPDDEVRTASAEQAAPHLAFMGLQRVWAVAGVNRSCDCTAVQYL